jgi:hypothetical protein
MKNAVPALLFGQDDGTLGPDGIWLPALPVPGLRAGLQGVLGSNPRNFQSLMKSMGWYWDGLTAGSSEKHTLTLLS